MWMALLAKHRCWLTSSLRLQTLIQGLPRTHRFEATSTTSIPALASFQHRLVHLPLLHPMQGLRTQAMTPKATSKKQVDVASDDHEDETDVSPKKVAKAKPAPRKRKQKEEPAADAGKEGDVEDEEDEEGVSPAKAKKPRASRAKKPTKKAAEEDEDEVDEGEEGEKAVPKKKPAANKSKAPPWPVYNESMRKPAPSEPHIKLLTWNVAGLRAVLKKDPECIKKLIERESPDIVCLQEIKLSDKHCADLRPQLGIPDDWHASWLCSADKAGYSGVATFSKVAPLSIQRGLGEAEHDGEGRLIITEYKDFYLVNVYVPNSGEGLKRLDYRVQPGGWDKTLAATVNKLQKTKPVLLTGDLNCAHQEIDIYYPKTNQKSAGFTPEERESLSTGLLGPNASGGCGLVDTFRKQFPEIVGYTYYSYRFKCREKGIGWRLDYNLASEALASKVWDSWLLSDVTGSDHVPLGVTIVNTSL